MIDYLPPRYSQKKVLQSCNKVSNNFLNVAGFFSTLRLYYIIAYTTYIMWFDNYNKYY